ncbi:protein ALTERED PHOSPHATE STARVATION RESPONSE 1-like [Andrographis paniculata]|uniref:protein ALTERED PHOSPHATE STARVATION RESPONSE 1-like n=1 Tax=Andrographis paniculata TaxID=175694 RepID=UPI0021E7DE4C|nr:protein ALTERED PHOSPHATE STARVATION RESPONSE 1-like [Andrographis paniculata]
MGCVASKLDESPAVALCRDRCSLLDHALRRRFAFAQSHAAYLLSLNSLALSFNLHRLFIHDSDSDSDSRALQPDELPGARGLTNLNFMKTPTTPSLLFTQPPMVPETMYSPEFSANDHNQNQDFDNINNYNYGTGGGLGGGSSPQASYSGDILSSTVMMPSVSNVSPPPPLPAGSSTWDFLNPFDSDESYYPANNTQSRDSRDVRKAEGIPDLEDVDDEEEVVKEIHGDERLVGGGETGIQSKPVALKDVPLPKHNSRSRTGVKNNVVEYKNAKAAQGRLKVMAKTSQFKPRSRFKHDLELVKEIQFQFERASNSGSEIAKFLQAGSLPYNEKHSNNQALSKLLHLPMASFLPSLSRGINHADPSVLIADEDVEVRSINQSSTLHKLYLWEKKLYEEVKAEEKLRVIHEDKSRKLKNLDEKGAETSKVDANRSLVRSLSTKIKIAMQVVDKISVKINNLRDEELWPQIQELILGFNRMWKSMMECHHSQFRAIGEAKQLDVLAFPKAFGSTQLEDTRQLEHLINWTLGFSSWVGAQKDYVRALNNWLMKCLLYVPEETPDGLAPFSPGRIGAPPVFVVCNQWSKSLDAISEIEVIDSMRDFASSVLIQWDQAKAEMHQKMSANHDEQKIKSLEKEDRKIQKKIQTLDKRMMQMMSSVNNGSVVYKRESIVESLRHVFEALEKYAASSFKVYEELLQQMDEGGNRVANDHPNPKAS